MKTVKDVSRISGVSVRTLHHYDAIGLLKPAQITGAGYRLYDDGALARLQTILLLRELRFPLKQIAQILDTPGFDPIRALEQQIRLLELERQYLDRLICHARSIQQTGVINMDFGPFNRSEQDRYAAEAKARWGSTDAYQEYEQKTAGMTGGQLRSAGDGLMDIFASFGKMHGSDPAGEDAQKLVAELQQYITDHFYICTKPILRGLGQMYIAGDAMTENIDRAGGAGTAAFASQAIAIYCSRG